MPLIANLFYAAAVHQRTRRNCWLKPEDLKRIQARKFCAILDHVVDNIPFYQEFYRQQRFRPAAIQDLEQLPQIPLIQKDIIQGAGLAAMGIGPDISDMIIFPTSGSSGKSLNVYYSAKEYTARHVFLMRSSLQNGFGLFERTMLVTTPKDFSHKFTFREQWGVLKVASVDVPVEALAATFFRFRPVILQGYVTALKALAGEVCRTGRADVRLKAVITTGEYLSQEDRVFMGKSFGAEVFDHYSASEFGMIAWECQAHQGLHVDADNVLVEVLRPDGSAAALSEEGDIVITSLNKTAMPFIRYLIGDRGMMLPGQCRCGRGFPLMKVSARPFPKAVFATRQA